MIGLRENNLFLSMKLDIFIINLFRKSQNSKVHNLTKYKTAIALIRSLRCLCRALAGIRNKNCTILAFRVKGKYEAIFICINNSVNFK